ncbi:MAG: hypothetical protein IT204_14900 [Fimbriimonadaceae bacterium]|nr:hypothetical protein [Fimbriimonadaceae bacterium]
MNKYEAHLVVIPEDGKDADLVRGFLMAPGVHAERVDLRAPAGGWLKAVSLAHQAWLQSMRRHPERRLLLVIDCDGNPGRLAEVTEGIPDELRDRVFVMGPLDSPEILCRETSQRTEGIGGSLAEACVANQPGLWQHPQLQHNAAELQRLADSVRAWLLGD